MHHIWKKVSLVLSAMIVGALVTAAALTMPRDVRFDAEAQDLAANVTRDAAPLHQQNLTAAEGLSSAFRNVAEAIRPSVVSIDTTQTQVINSRGRIPGLFDAPTAPQRRELSGMGSGVIVRPDGYILTNNHVVSGADSLVVELHDGKKMPGVIIGTDPKTDLAVVKIDGVGLQAAPMGNSDAIQVGDWVLAIGSPFGLDQTVTAGIISGKNRVQQIIDDGDGFEDFLQTDAAINPGNSGGPLVNLRGELVGINTAIMSRSGASAGIGFAIPVSLAEPVLESIIETGEVHRGFLGARVEDVTARNIESLGLKVQSGALIGNVLAGQPAANAGLRKGDVVTTIDGRPCRGGTQLRNYVANQRPGTVIEMGVNRFGRSLQIEVHLQERTDEVMAKFRSGSVFGLELVPVTPNSARKYGYDGLSQGLIVTGVNDDSPAASELEVGDVIEMAAGMPLRRVAELEQIIVEATQQGQGFRLVVRRGDRQMLLVIRPGMAR